MLYGLDFDFGGGRGFVAVFSGLGGIVVMLWGLGVLMAVEVEEVGFKLLLSRLLRELMFVVVEDDDEDRIGRTDVGISKAFSTSPFAEYTRKRR